MRKSNNLSSRYRPGTSRGPIYLATFREQMTDYAKGDVLLGLRSQARKSREQVAAEIGVTTKTLFTWEKKDGAIKWANAQRLARFYNVDPESVITRDGDGPEPSVDAPQLNRIERKLDTILEALRIAAPVLPDELAEQMLEALLQAEADEQADTSVDSTEEEPPASGAQG